MCFLPINDFKRPLTALPSMQEFQGTTLRASIGPAGGMSVRRPEVGAHSGCYAVQAP